MVYDYKNWDSFSLRFHSISHTVKLEDVIDMPNREDEFVYCSIDKNYRKLIQDYIFTEEGIDIATGERELRLFTVDRALNMTMKLMQLCSGFIKDIEGNWIRLNTLKRDAFEEWFDDKWEGIKDHKRKVVIFYQFNISGDDIEEVLKGKKLIYRRIDGSVSDKNKDYYKHLFKTAEFGDPEGCDIIVINYGTGTEGMNFQRGTIMGFYDQTLEFRKKEQAGRRIYRRGQTKDCLFVHFVTKKSKEIEIFQNLAKIKDFSLWLNEVNQLSLLQL
jgi:SNF2 family DNA or RNA helicase